MSRWTLSVLVAVLWSCAITQEDLDAWEAVAESSSSGGLAPTGKRVMGPHGGTLIEVGSGTFDMGCTQGQDECRSNESPVRPVTLTHDVYVGETEVTQREYEAIVGVNPSSFRDCGVECPVENVTWSEAAYFANLVSALAGLTACYECGLRGSGIVVCSVALSPYSCDGYRLLTEAEWEGAARCGADLRYAGSDDVSKVAWYGENASATQPVARLAPNACGLYDMSGNVSEYTQDGFDWEYYERGEDSDPEGDVDAPGQRVRRGGNYRASPTQLRVSYRDYWDSTDSRIDFIGFRLARTVLWSEE